ncbi:putative alpha/beta superfamily hydrolase [Fontibacillus solani]|uniref:Putative alpha/beta superfamily hydrolase n=1 Tax=Fontibacillus solani TaxID=1572857 RepID=A0A7W3XQN4_9BACL|nr:putative alpha/beta superfamily hydrolase [Fontibacillus solani]
MLFSVISQNSPIFYMLDANSVFGTIVEAIRLQSHRPDTPVLYLQSL